MRTAPHRSDCLPNSTIACERVRHRRCPSTTDGSAATAIASSLVLTQRAPAARSAILPSATWTTAAVESVTLTHSIAVGRWSMSIQQYPEHHHNHLHLITFVASATWRHCVAAAGHLLRPSHSHDSADPAEIDRRRRYHPRSVTNDRDFPVTDLRLLDSCIRRFPDRLYC